MECPSLISLPVAERQGYGESLQFECRPFRVETFGIEVPGDEQDRPVIAQIRATVFTDIDHALKQVLAGRSLDAGGLPTHISPTLPSSSILPSALIFAGEMVPQYGHTSACFAGFQCASAPQLGQLYFCCALTSSLMAGKIESGFCGFRPSTPSSTHG